MFIPYLANSLLPFKMREQSASILRQGGITEGGISRALEHARIIRHKNHLQSQMQVDFQTCKLCQNGKISL